MSNKISEICTQLLLNFKESVETYTRANQLYLLLLYFENDFIAQLRTDCRLLPLPCVHFMLVPASVSYVPTDCLDKIQDTRWTTHPTLTSEIWLKLWALQMSHKMSNKISEI